MTDMIIHYPKTVEEELFEVIRIVAVGSVEESPDVFVELIMGPLAQKLYNDILDRFKVERK